MNDIRTALGFIETVGLVAAITAADAALKSANVSLIGREISKGYGYVTVKIAGDVGAVKAALSAARATCEKVNRVWSVDVIPRPGAGLGPVMAWNSDTKGADQWIAQRTPEPLPASEVCAPTASEEQDSSEEDSPQATEPDGDTVLSENAPDGDAKATGKPVRPSKGEPRRKKRR